MEYTVLFVLNSMPLNLPEPIYLEWIWYRHLFFLSNQKYI